jgi:cytochrome c oxidase assembly protein Cox11
MSERPQVPEVQSDNRTILRKLVIVSVLMFGFGWALVPLYRKICEITGINVVTLRRGRRAIRRSTVRARSPWSSTPTRRGRGDSGRM